MDGSPLSARDWLEQLRMLRADIAATEGRIRRIDEQLGLHGIDYNRAGGSPKGAPGDAEAALISELIERRRDLAELQRRYLDADAEAAYVLGAIGDPDGKLAVALRYLDGASWSRIASRLGFGSRETARSLVERTIDAMDVWLVPVLQQYREEQAR